MITDDALVLYFYNDGLSSGERDQIERELEQDTQLSQRYSQLVKDMGRVSLYASTNIATVDKSQWARALDARIDSSIKQSSSGQSKRHIGSDRKLAIAATVLVFIAGWFLGGMFTQVPSEVDINPRVAVRSGESADLLAVRQSNSQQSLIRGIAAHFKDTQSQLASMDENNTVERDALIQAIVVQNRFFLEAARNNGADDLARLLRAFEPLLVSLSSSSQGQPRSKQQISDQLEFELGATLTKLDRKTSNNKGQY